MRIGYKTHIQNQGWGAVVYDGATSGTVGLSLRMEALTVEFFDKTTENVGVEYRSHVQNIGWMDWVADGEISGTVGESLRLEAIQIRLTGDDAKRYELLYRIHVENIGWQPYKKNDEIAGTVGVALRAEAIEIVVLKRPTPPKPPIDPDDYDPDDFEPDPPDDIEPEIIPETPIIVSIPTENSMSAKYTGHIENYGWSSPVFGGMMVGTVGRSLRLEAFTVEIINKGSLDLGVTYEAYCENLAWLGAVSNGAIAGTEGQNLRMESVRMQLTGADAADYKIWYRCHLQNYGWTDYSTNWETCGTIDEWLRIEALEIVITTASQSLIRQPGQIGGVSTKYKTHIQDLGWTGYVKNGVKSGTTGRGLRLEAFTLELETLEAIDIGVRYRSHVENIGWQPWVDNGAISGTEGQSLRLEAFEIELTGADAADYKIMYRAHIENKGWSDWSQNGETCGTTGEALRAEAICIIIIALPESLTDVTNEIKNKAPYTIIWVQDYPYAPVLLHDVRTENRLVGSPTMQEGIKNITSLTFEVSPDHPGYNDIHLLRSTIFVYEEKSNAVTEQTFEGRVISVDIDFNNVKTVVCEGELSYFNDTIQRPRIYTDLNIEEYFNTILANHNIGVTADKRILPGICTVVDTSQDAERIIDKDTTTFKALSDMVDKSGGYFVIQRIGGIRFLDYIDNYRVTNSQPIEFGTNLLSINRTTSGDGVYTAVVPYGAEIDDGENQYTVGIATVNNNCDFIYDPAAVNLYGWIYAHINYNNISDPTTLLNKATTDLNTITNSMGLVIDVTALDLALINIDIEKIKVGDAVRVLSPPHDIDTFLIVTEITRSLEDLTDGVITLGGSVPSLTDYVSGTAERNYYGSNAVNGAKNLEFVSNELMFLVKATETTVEETAAIVNETVLRVDTHSITLAAYEGQFADIDATVEDLESAVATLNTDTANLLSTVATLTGRVDDTETDIDGLLTRVSDAELKITPSAIVATVAQYTTYDEDIAELDTRLDAAELKITPSAIVATVAQYTTYSNDINNLESRLDAAELKITPSAITLAVTSSSTYINDLGKKVNAASIINSINLSTEGITINANKLTLSGLVTVTTYNNLVNGLANGTTTIDGDCAELRVVTGAKSGQFYSNTSRGVNILSTDDIYIACQSARNTISLYGNVSTTGAITMAGSAVVNTPTSTTYKVSNFRWMTTSDYLEFTCNEGARGVDTWSSDKKLKRNIVPTVIKGKEKIKLLQVRDFDWIKSNSAEIGGLIADEVETALGEHHVLKILQEDGTEIKQLRAKTLIPILIKAVQELSDDVDMLNDEIKNLKKKEKV